MEIYECQRDVIKVGMGMFRYPMLEKIVSERFEKFLRQYLRKVEDP